MRIRVKFFAILRERSGTPEIELEAPTVASVTDLRKKLSERFPDLHDLLAKSAIAVNQTYAGPDARLAPDDEVALIPPVSGG